MEEGTSSMGHEACMCDRRELKLETEGPEEGGDREVKRKRLLPESVKQLTNTDRQANIDLTSSFMVPLAQRETKSKALIYKGQIFLARTQSEAVYLCSSLLLDKPSVCGFDIEWRVSYEAGFPPRKAALIQICYRSGSTDSNRRDENGSDCKCFLFQLFHSGLPKCLLVWLEKDTVPKAGANIRGDACKLQADYGLRLGGLVDLGEMARSCSSHPMTSGAGGGHGLSSLVKEVTQGKYALLKPQRVRTGDWEARDLSEAQVMYAATDAFASLLVYEALSAKALPNPLPAASDHQETKPQDTR